MTLTTFLKGSLVAQLQIAQGKAEDLERSLKTFQVALLLYSLSVSHSVCRKGEGFSCCWEQWHCRVASARVDLFLQQCESLQSPLRSLWELSTSPPSPQELSRSLFCTGYPEPRRICKSSTFGIKLQTDPLLSNIFRHSRQSQSSECWLFLSFERLKILPHLGTFWCVPTCKREIWLHCVAGGCFCVWQSWLGSAFVDTWDQRAAWPDTLLLLPCSYIITGGYC